MSRGLRQFLLQCLGISMTGGAAASAQQPVSDTAPAPAPALSPAPFFREVAAARRPNLPELGSYRLFESERVWVAVQDSADAEPIVAGLRIAAARFERIFDKPAVRGMVVVHPAKQTGDVDGALRRQLGTRWSQWIESFPQPGKRRNYILDFIRHEVTHAWHSQAYPAPSRAWFQETVALLMEQQRHWDEKPSFSKQHVALDQLFVMGNPATNVIMGGGSMDTMLAFYAQLSRMIDFLMEQGLDPGLFRSIAENGKNGAEMPQWLPAYGPRYGLPTTVAELDQAWRTWSAAHRPDSTAKAP